MSKKSEMRKKRKGGGRQRRGEDIDSKKTMGDGTLRLYTVSVVVNILHIIVAMFIALHNSCWYQEKRYRFTAPQSPVVGDGKDLYAMGL
ncbi:hypothetical protein Pcinc_021948 [Petrolisthes cinctipes]|uniref:Uncharacterized protein n=1 Tax=Petrolisthes cinctipes TaxID=88211 RepID=A0AAE1KHK8_PETCI|nr:hypothetical protein Pcinc_021948 [Petrolisthes cinctipes]